MTNKAVRTVVRGFRMELWVVASILFLSVVTPFTDPMWVKVEQSRVYRDFFGLTPFRSVRPEIVTIQGGVMTVMGSLIKQRDCEILERSVWVEDEFGILHQTVFQSGPVPNLPPVKRFVSEKRQAFGPIIITPPDGVKPVGAVMFASHLCYILDKLGKRVSKDGHPVTERQDNVFFEVKWEPTP